MKSYYIHQKITAFVNKYSIYEANGDVPGKLIAFAQQKRWALKEEIIFYTDESKQTEVFRLKGRKVLEIAGTYDVTAGGETLGILQKQFKESLIRSTWHITKPDTGDTLLILHERSESLALLRRMWGFLPIVGDLPFFFKYHFDFFDPALGNVKVGTYEKTTVVRDHYRLTMEDAVYENVDWRVLVAQGVALDALQSR